MTSSITVLLAFSAGKLSVCDQIIIKTSKGEKSISNNFYMNFHLKDNLRMELVVYWNEIMQEGALTSFALYDPHRKNVDHEE